MHEIKVNFGDLEIKIKGKSDQFWGLDLQVEAIKALIEMIDLKFAREKDAEIVQKVYLSILDTLGANLKVDIMGFNSKKRNIEAVNEFIKWCLDEKLYEREGFAELLDQEDDELDFGAIFADYLKNNRNLD
ncbi:hypothetical protein [Calidifontibacillus erzurumensis]|uniref:hypothetical protein n=1 Tax=Calidifontibacillus erzurumensis TaxID=2741433 RepID=UPI0035B553AF